MHIIAIGLNHRTAPVEVRERFAFADAELPHALKLLKETKSILECVIVATCNRTEIYAVVDRLHVCGHYLRHFLETWFHVPVKEFNDHLYIYEDEEAIRHLFQVACGLDSMVVGETQILGQVRNAFLLAQQQGATGKLFNMLFKQAVTVAKRAHTETSIGENAVSISYAAVELGKRIFGDFHGKTVTIVGAGKMSELTVKHLHANGAEQVIVLNRTLAKAAELADKFGGLAQPMERMREALLQSDIVISSTGSADYVMTRADVESVLTKRGDRPLFMIDIAVPRDLDPMLAELPNVFLYDIDDLEGIVESNLEQRRLEALKIDSMIEAEIGAYHLWYRTLGVSPVIQALQEKAADVHEETMQSLLNKLPDLDEREINIIRKLSKSMVNQMLSDPIQRIKEKAGERGSEEAVKLFIELFALEDRVERLQEQDRARRKTDDGPKQPAALEPIPTINEDLPVRAAR